ncbi:MAG: formate dehydrogenase accessory sulfurtransferase FdhD [Gammaproteobacteria bacterium]|nr:formate dehydrogenase accessory sulfurtransferase FdhD [Gammaproteobacteria bacterium]
MAIDIRKVRGDSAQSVTDRVAVEEPLEIRVGYSVPAGRTATSVSVTMRTPGNDAELALGFLYSESIICSNSDVVAIDHSGPAAPDSGNRNIIRIDLADGVIPDLERLQRNFYTTSSCGVCGKSSLDALRVIGATRLTMIKRQFSRTALIGLPDALRDQQATFKETGGLHAAAAFNSHGDIEVVREDVGRHNAVDKVVGALLQEERLPAADCGLIVSGRASFELLQKTLVAGIPLLAAVSAPSSLAVRLAQEFDVTLVGFLRGDAFNIYSAGERIS